jgi:hypothetical protein
MPIWASSASRRGLAEANTSCGIAAVCDAGAEDVT